jgi:integrating conjugative element protein (TIGR03746 family)
MVYQENAMSGGKLVTGWIMNAWKKDDALKQAINLQNKFILMLLLVITGLIIGWMREPSNLTLYVPPDIQNGATIKANTIPNPLIYSFAYEVWEEINTWPKNGEIEYKQNIQTYWSYLSPQFMREMLDNFEELKLSGQLQRIRYMQGMSGSAFDPNNVKKLGNDTWEVDLKMHVSEYKNNQIVKDVEIVYPLKIARVNIARSLNPYELAITGFVSEPKRINTLI